MESQQQQQSNASIDLALREQDEESSDEEEAMIASAPVDPSLYAPNQLQPHDFQPLLDRVFLSEMDLLDTIHSIFPKGIKVCRKDKWRAGPNIGMHKKWRFVCECGGQPRMNGSDPSSRRSKKVGCPFFINVFWPRDLRGPRITTASFYHFGHEDVEINLQALNSLKQDMLPIDMLKEGGLDPEAIEIQKEMLISSLKLKIDNHLRWMVLSNYPLDVVVKKVNDFMSQKNLPRNFTSQESFSPPGSSIPGGFAHTLLEPGVGGGGVFSHGGPGFHPEAAGIALGGMTSQLSNLSAASASSVTSSSVGDVSAPSSSVQQQNQYYQDLRFVQPGESEVGFQQLSAAAGSVLSGERDGSDDLKEGASRKRKDPPL